MNKSWRSAWRKKAELSDHADSDTTKEAPPWRLCTTSVWRRFQAVDGGHGSDHFHGLDLRKSQAACGDSKSIRCKSAQFRRSGVADVLAEISGRADFPIGSDPVYGGSRESC